MRAGNESPKSLRKLILMEEFKMLIEEIFKYYDMSSDIRCKGKHPECYRLNEIFESDLKF